MPRPTEPSRGSTGGGGLRRETRTVLYAPGASAHLLRRVASALDGEILDHGGHPLLALRSVADGLEAAGALASSGSVGLASGDVEVDDGGDVRGGAIDEAIALGSMPGPRTLLSELAVRLGGLDRGNLVAVDVECGDGDGPVYELAVEAAPRSPVPFPATLAAAGADRLIGRGDAIRAAEAEWSTACGGSRRVLLVGGHAGAGKTRFASEFGSLVHGDGAIVLHGACTEELEVPFQPFVEAIVQLRRHVDLGQLVGEGTLRDLAELAPRRGQDRAIAADPSGLRYWMFEAVVDVLRSVAAVAPVFFAIDDLHWAGRPTVRLLERLVRAGQLERVMVVGTFRDTADALGGPFGDVVYDLAREPGVSTLSLAPLTEDEVRAFASTRAGSRASDVPDLVVEYLAAATGGNAYLLVELWGHLVATGMIGWHDGGWRLGDLDTADSPRSVRSITRHRLSGLSATARQVALLGAVAAPTIDPTVLAVAADISVAEVVGALDDLHGAGLLTRADGAHRFVHGLTRQAVEEGLSGRERAEAHLALATALAASGNADDAAIARHMVEAVPLVSIEAALECVFGAARAALRTVAHEDAISLLGGALALDLAPRQRAAVLTDLGAAFAVAGLAADCTRVCTEAAAIGRRLGDDELVVQAALRSAEATWRAAGRDPAPAAALLDEALRIERRPVERARLLGAMSAVMAFAGDQPSARRRRDEALSLAEPLGDPQLLLDVIHSGLYCEVVPEEVDQQLELCRRGSRLAEEQGDDVALLKLSAKAVLRLTVKPEPEWLRAELARSDRLARRLRDPYYLLANHGFQVLQALSEGRFDDAERAALSGRDGWADFGQDADVGQGVQMFSIRREQGRLRELRAVLELGARLDPAAAWKPGLAALYTEIGLVERAGEVVDEACTDRLRSVARDSVYPAALSYLAEAAAVAGRREAAAVIADELGPYAGMYLSVPGLVCYGSADRYLGMLAECLGDLSGARAHLEAAVGIDEAAGWPVWAAHSQHALGSLLLRTGPTRERRRGVSLVKAALDIARSLGMGALAERGEAALASADAGGAASAPAPAGTTLTRREREVLGLVAEGLTNRQIGQRLFASPHTIANHVRSILAKTGSGNRTEAAAWAHRAGLVGRHARSDSD